MKKLSAVVVIVLLAALALNAAQERKTAPQFSLKDQAGKVHSLKRLSGKVIVLDFGRVICIPCRKVMDDLNSLHSAYSGKGAAVYSVNLGVDQVTLRKYIADKKLRFPFLEDPGMSVTRAYGVEMIPYVVVIDKKGRIYKTHTGHSDNFKATLESEIKTLLAEKAG